MMYDLMLELPVFQGLSHDQLTSILEKVPFHFKKFKSNEYLFRSGEPFEEVMFVLSGRIRIITPTYRESILIAEDFEAPYTIPFYYLFGRETNARSSVYAQGPVGVMTLDKERFLQMIENNRLMLINVLNILSSHAQKQHLALDSVGELNPQLRLATWMLEYTSRPARNIIIDADMKDWCSLFNMSEETFVKAVKELTDAQLIEFDDGKLKLTDRYGLQTFVSRNGVRK